MQDGAKDDVRMLMEIYMTKPKVGENGSPSGDVVASILIIHFYNMVTPCLNDNNDWYQTPKDVVGRHRVISRTIA
jgi:hypothetical protein